MWLFLKLPGIGIAILTAGTIKMVPVVSIAINKKLVHAVRSMKCTLISMSRYQCIFSFVIGNQPHLLKSHGDSTEPTSVCVHVVILV